MSHLSEDGSSPFLTSSLGKRKLGKDHPISPRPSQHDTTKAEQPANGENSEMSDDSPTRIIHEDLDDPIFSHDAETPDWYREPGSHVWWSDGPDERSIHAKPAVAAIFIHAGAGYHSTTNERLHLDACSDAARAAMKLLKLGASAVEGVEAAIKVLEDREITNAGFGSNLAIDGTVECDATIVDHYGRSGACGATPNIKNPISLAKMILLESHKALSLRRVPPNLLIGEGAKDFAVKHGMPLVPNEWLVSRNAFDRYERWAKELKSAEDALGHSTPALDVSSSTDDTLHKGHEKRDHTNAIATGTWNEGQPDSPAPATPSDSRIMPMTPSALKALPPVLHNSSSPRSSTKVSTDRSPLSFFGSLTSPRSNSGGTNPGSPIPKKARVKRGMSKDGKSEMETGDRPSSVHSPKSDQEISDTANQELIYEKGEDKITDTVGAIAIDQWGNMAAGSSSGGIGMKHIGRIGPAALVGIGTALIPRSDMTDRPANERDTTRKDKNKAAEPADWKTVAVVTSGTGEHMAISQASQKCAERLYYETKRGADGNDVHEEDETILMENFVVQDFQKHPGVLRTPSASAIGAMAVKQTSRGYYLFFAHNTDSFALASMSSNDRQPHCVMSRLGEGSMGVAQGSRKIASS
ncbi:hypothetical protein PFICI_03685 [Pestalotiopsis fici W106-1]|uniref:Asparaginase n=1 Tax=Pestalotiopsis fici (strain W106-1 / CGMCC3.15140) TaxID=1229662 RepID=W3XI17_PESFW|nr:uncharacterized protein PFICI_03685 [Pestalotiopsis fici W106-1]ETS85660.1 hypothetical protein PFICI_03685 [Pestalotiopsis fici W106-1]